MQVYVLFWQTVNGRKSLISDTVGECFIPLSYRAPGVHAPPNWCQILRLQHTKELLPTRMR